MPDAGRPTTIAVCTDLHYWPGGPSDLGSDGSLQLLPQSETLLASLVDEMKQLRPDLLFFLGDLISGGGGYSMPPTEFDAALLHTRRMLCSTGAPTAALPGNHDCPPGGSGWSAFETLWGLAPGLGQTIDRPEARLILLNAQGHSPQQIAAGRPGDPVYGWVNEDELARLERELNGAAGRPVLLFVHQLLLPWSGNGGWRAFYGVENAAAVLDILARAGNVAAVFQGHAHRMDVQAVALGGRASHFVVAPALIEYPVGWLHLTLTPSLLRVELRSLPLPHLIEQTRASGEGQGWRAGPPAWRDFTIQL